MTGLVLELQRDCLNGVKVSELLLKSLVTARKLKITEIEEWLDKELNGYDADDDIPSYRTVKGQIMIWNPIDNQLTPFVSKDQETLEHISMGKCKQKISELEFFLADGSKPIEMPLHPQNINYLMVATGLMIVTGCQSRPCLIMDKIQIEGILASVKNKILDWSSDLEQQGILGEGMSFSKEEKQKAGDVYFNINGNVTNSPIQVGTHDSTQSFSSTTIKNDLKTVIDELKSFISNPNLKPEQVDEVNEAIATLEIQEKSTKPKLAIIRGYVENVKGIMDTLGVTPESIVSFLTSMPQF